MIKKGVSIIKVFVQVRLKSTIKITIKWKVLENWLICIIMAATRSKTSSDSKRGNLDEGDIQMSLKLVKELLK